MSERREDLDDLFGEGGGQTEARTTPAIALSIGGVILSVLGMACLAAPGGVPVLLALWWIERERDRVANGYQPESAGPVVERTRRLVFASLAVVVMLFTAQAVLYCFGFYEGLGDIVFTGGPVLRAR
jgi:hypothetical protein